MRRHAATNLAGPLCRPGELFAGPLQEFQSPFISYPQLMKTRWPNVFTRRARSLITESCDPEMIVLRLVPSQEISGIRPCATSQRSIAAGNAWEEPDDP